MRSVEPSSRRKCALSVNDRTPLDFVAPDVSRAQLREPEKAVQVFRRRSAEAGIVPTTASTIRGSRRSEAGALQGNRV